MLYKSFLTFELVDEILKCVYSNKRYSAVLFPDAVGFSIFCRTKIGNFSGFERKLECRTDLVRFNDLPKTRDNLGLEPINCLTKFSPNQLFASAIKGLHKN